MKRKNNKYYIRKTHRYLGVIIGVQFLFWTVSGLYFTWTDLDEIHGDHFIKEQLSINSINSNELNLSNDSFNIESLELKFIANEAYFWVNDSVLVHSRNGKIKPKLTAKEAQLIARDRVKAEFEIQSVDLLTETDAHHEYRGRNLPVWQVKFSGDDSIIAYVDAQNGDFKTVRHRDWRWFDFLWMTHTMDYKSRDDFNNILIRAFSLFGLLTVCSGFLLFFVTTKKKPRKKSS